MGIVTSVFICGVHAGLAASLYVSPSGNDENSGLSSKQPLKTFESVLEKVARLPKSWPSDLIVHVMPGEYFVESPIRITSAHSSENDRKLIFRNSGALASAVLIGGKRMNPDRWQEYKPGVYYQDLPDVDDIDIIYEDRMKARRARMPNYRHQSDFPTADGDYFVSTRVGNREPSLTTKDTDLSKAFLSLLAADMNAGVKHHLVTWGHGSCDWHKWIYEVAKVVPDKNKIFVTEKNPLLSQKGKKGHNRYYIEGGLRLLDTKGEFFFDQQRHRLYYMPRGDLRKSEVVYATTKNIFQLDKAKNVTIEGLKFTCTDVLAKTAAAYTWDDPDAAISAVESGHIAILKCHFRSIGQTAVNLRSTHNSAIENCLMEYLGQSGIKLYYSDNNLIRNNLIHDIGLRRVYCEGVALHTSKNNTVRHLEIYNSARYGITLRARVDKKTGVSQHPTTGNLLEYIKIHDVNQDSGDTAGLHMAMINYPTGPNYTNTCNQITIHRSIAQPDITDEWKPTGVYLDHPKAVMNQSLSNIEVTDYDPRYPGYDPKRFKGLYGPDARTSDRERQIMQHRPHNNASSTKFNCSWSPDFDKKLMEYNKIGLTAEFPAEYRSNQANVTK